MKKTLLIVAAILMLVSCENISEIAELILNNKEESTTTTQTTTVQTTTVSTPAGTTQAFDYASIGAYNYDGIAEAKAYALANDRPLVLITSLRSCTLCTMFENQVLGTKAFGDYVKKSGIVVVNCRNDLLQTTVYYTYKTGYGMIYDGTPAVYVFKVKEGADCKTVNARAFGKDQVELVKDAVTGRCLCGSYSERNPFGGIATGKPTEWSGSTFAKQLEAALQKK